MYKKNCSFLHVQQDLSYLRLCPLRSHFCNYIWKIKYSTYLHKNVHEGPIISVGSSFVLQYRNNNEFNENLEWLKVAIAHSRIIVEDDIKKGRIKPDSYLCLAPIYAVVYWLPMRKDISTSITLDNRQKNTTYLVETVINKSKQISFFEDYDEN